MMSRPEKPSKDIPQLISKLREDATVLKEHRSKWTKTKTTKTLSTAKKIKAVQAVVSAKMISKTLIPNLIKKMEIFQSRNQENVELIEKLTSEWEELRRKILANMRQFDELETSPVARPTVKRNNNDRDLKISLNIEKSLKSKATQSKSIFNEILGRSRLKTTVPEEGTPDGMIKRKENVHSHLHGAGDDEDSDSSRSFGSGGPFDGAGDAATSARDSLKNVASEIGSSKSPRLFPGLSDDPSAFDEVQRFIFRGKETSNDSSFLNAFRNDFRTQPALRGSITELDETDTNMKSSRHKNKPKDRNDLFDDRIHQNLIPQPIPIDNILKFVDTFPKEVEIMIREQFEATESQDDFLKGNSKLGKMSSTSDTSELKDVDFISGEPERNLKDLRIDDAIRRCFGSFNKR